MASSNKQLEQVVDEASQPTPNNLLGGVNDAVQRGVSALKGQVNTVREHGIDGVKKDMSDYARNKPLTALAIAGGIGALAALIISRR
jgi:ElaB/YqjD/DUF883 family membrane-anchored ribosome-binding protein